MHDISRLSAPHRVTLQIAELLERGVRPWLMPWDTAVGAASLLPRRQSGEAYRGINVIALWAAATQAGFASPYWLTFKQTLALGGAVRKGERGAFVVFYKPLHETDNAPAASDDADDRPGRRSILRGYTVFNRDQIDGLKDFEPVTPTVPPRDGFAELFSKVPADVRHGGVRAFYAQASDHVQMPNPEAFRDLTQYYATLAHEFGHWTRHPSRLDRDFGATRFGDHGYALEELVAELCSAFIGAEIGLPPDHLENHAAYISGWLKSLSDKPSAFLTAAAKAQLAADYLLRVMGVRAGEREPPA